MVNTFGKELGELAHKYRVSGRKIADSLGYSHVFVYKLLHGERKAPKNVVAIKRVIELFVDKASVEEIQNLSLAFFCERASAMDLINLLPEAWRTLVVGAVSPVVLKAYIGVDKR